MKLNRFKGILIILILIIATTTFYSGVIYGRYERESQVDQMIKTSAEMVGEYNLAREQSFELAQLYSDISKKWRKADLLCIESYNKVVRGGSMNDVKSNIEQRNKIIDEMDTYYADLKTLIEKRQSTNYKYVEVNYYEVPTEDL